MDSVSNSVSYKRSHSPTSGESVYKSARTEEPGNATNQKIQYLVQEIIAHKRGILFKGTSMKGEFLFRNGETYTGCLPFGRGISEPLTIGLGTLTLKNSDKIKGYFVGGEVEKKIWIKSAKDKEFNGLNYNFKLRLCDKAALEHANEGICIPRFEHKNDDVVKATLEYASGGKYIGQFKALLPHGEGTLYYENGDIFTGNFIDGFAHGEGDFFNHENGKWQDATFDFGEKI